MKKYRSRINRFLAVAALSFSVILTGCAAKKEAVGDKISVMTSFYPVYDFTLKVGGDKVNVKNMVPAGTEPHEWEPGTRDIASLEESNVFIYSGAGMEHWTEDVLKSLSNKSLIVVEASSGITLKEGHEEEGDHKEEENEHDHGEFDPHVWLDPKNAKKEMENIKDGLVKADPENKDYYEANYKTYAEKFDQLDQSFQETLSPLSNKSIVVSHEAYGYLCSAYGLTQVGIEGLTPDSEPDPARMAEVIDYVRDNQVKTIFFEELVSPKVAEAIAKETGAKTEVLSPVEGLSDKELKAGEDYFSVMEKNLAALKEALE
ncbi:metal ABC transporter substrate-binding protein [Lacrimispora sp.]|uniref:metal ABC transporter substrate-binding protein n=1 Tax=Lacrimispora sp. TaxID=2719234 RepID=UPI0028AA2CB3|nr:metal ABC transporter substrate-binding protein [Lacrimispora sp.]